MKYYLLLLVQLLLVSSCKYPSDNNPSHTAQSSNAFKFHHIVRQPSSPSTNPPVLILLHGLGSNENDLFSFAKYLDPRLLVVCPQGPIQRADNGYSWYGLSASSAGWQYDIETVNQVSKDLVSFIKQISSHYKVDESKIFIGGFSQGAILSLTTGLIYPDQVAGIVCLSGALYPELKSQLSSKKEFNELEIFISHGTQDKVLPYSDIVSDVPYLKKLGLDPELNYYDTGHTISQENLQDMIDWISNKLD